MCKMKQVLTLMSCLAYICFKTEVRLNFLFFAFCYFSVFEVVVLLIFLLCLVGGGGGAPSLFSVCWYLLRQNVFSVSFCYSFVPVFVIFWFTAYIFFPYWCFWRCDMVLCCLFNGSPCMRFIVSTFHLVVWIHSVENWVFFLWLYGCRLGAGLFCWGRRCRTWKQYRNIFL